MSRKIKIILYVLAAFFIALLLAAGFGFFPVARVGDSYIYYREMQKLTRAAEAFKFSLNTSPFKEELDQGADARKAALGELIFQRIVKNAFGGFGGISQKEIDENMAKVLGGADPKKLAEAARQLYALGYEDFKKYVILPKVEEAVLEGKVEASGKMYDEWFSEKLKTARVSIYFLPYIWKDGDLVNKSRTFTTGY